MLFKDKNVAKAEALFASEKVDTNLNVEQLMKLHLDMEAAEKAFAELFDKVKKFHNEVYAPMCEQKTEAEVRMHLLRLRFEAVTAANPSFKALVKMAKRAAKK